MITLFPISQMDDSQLRVQFSLWSLDSHLLLLIRVLRLQIHVVAVSSRDYIERKGTKSSVVFSSLKDTGIPALKHYLRSMVSSRVDQLGADVDAGFQDLYQTIRGVEMTSASALPTFQSILKTLSRSSFLFHFLCAQQRSHIIEYQH